MSHIFGTHLSRLIVEEPERIEILIPRAFYLRNHFFVRQAVSHCSICLPNVILFILYAKRCAKQLK